MATDTDTDTEDRPAGRPRYARYAAIALALAALQVLVLYLMGQPFISTSGHIKLWEGVVLSPSNSQHITDWYTFSHILHGFLFYGLAWVAFRKQPVGVRFLIAVGVETGWEILENTPIVIDHYRQQALAQGYTGDSILNSVCDNLSMMLGFLAAWRWPVWAVVALGIGFELFVAYSIRDNLTLNIINLIHVFEPIAQWQAGA